MGMGGVFVILYIDTIFKDSRVSVGTTMQSIKIWFECSNRMG